MSHQEVGSRCPIFTDTGAPSAIITGRRQMPMWCVGCWVTTVHHPTRTMLSMDGTVDAFIWMRSIAQGWKVPLQTARLMNTQDGAAIIRKKLESNAMSQVNAVRTFHLQRVSFGTVAGFPRDSENDNILS